MGYHAPFMSHNQLNYSWRYWFATGVHHIRRHSVKNANATLGSLNFLLKRWNGSGLQANLYGVIGGGHSEISGDPKTIGMAALQFDIEDRDYYFLAKHQQLFNDKFTELEQTVVRAGVTPYIDPFDGFHTWIILEWQDFAFNRESNQSDITPYLRFFYRNILFEIGQSFTGVTRFNYITHF